MMSRKNIRIKTDHWPAANLSPGSSALNISHPWDGHPSVMATIL
jgi:hypothetical protein